MPYAHNFTISIITDELFFNIISGRTQSKLVEMNQFVDADDFCELDNFAVDEEMRREREREPSCMCERQRAEQSRAEEEVIFDHIYVKLYLNLCDEYITYELRCGSALLLT